MEQTRKQLRTMSIVVLILAGLSLLNILFELFLGELSTEFQNATIPEGAPENVGQIAQIFILVVALLLLLPHLYIGIKGIKIAKKPDSSKAHIVWGILLIVLTAIGLVSPVLALVQGNGEAFENVSELCSIFVDVVVLAEYVKYAIAVRKKI